MSRRLYQMVVLMTLASPQAVRALGLGEIHVDSALNEPLNAYIDIVGASADDLRELKASIADRETFQHFGADRPAFLLSSRFKIQLDGVGHPVLNVRSSQSFTDPVVSLLVDLRWPHGQLVREYSLLLDPAGFGARVRPEPVVVAAAEPPAAPRLAPPLPVPPVPVETPVAARRHRTGAAPSNPPRESRASESTAAVAATQYKVKARDTLRMIARSTGARSETRLKRTMIAIFRGNPSAFDGNINRLHRDAVLNLPSAEQIEAVTAAEAKREVHEHITAWRAGSGTGAAAAKAPPQTTAVATVPAALPETPEALSRRVRALEEELESLNGLLRSQNAQLQEMQQKVSDENRRPAITAPAAEPAAAAAPATAPATPTAPVDTVESDPAQPHQGGHWGWLVAAFGLLVTGIGASRLWRRRHALTPPVRPIHPYDIEDAYRASEERHRSEARVAPAVPTEGIIVTHEGRALEELEPAEPAEAVRAGAAAHEAAPAGAGAAGPTIEETILLKMGDVTTRLEAQPSAASDETAIDTAIIGDLSSTSARTARIAVDAQRASGDTVRLSGETLRSRTADTVRIGGDATRQLKKKADSEFTMIDLSDGAGVEPGLDESTAQHVQMPSMLNQQPVQHERRTNFVDVLKGAIARDPARGDLQLKLLELYFGNAANNRTAFLEIAHQLTQQPQAVDPETWEKIQAMGRQIAPENPLFADQSAGDTVTADTVVRDGRDLADCA